MTMAMVVIMSMFMRFVMTMTMVVFNSMCMLFMVFMAMVVVMMIVVFCSALKLAVREIYELLVSMQSYSGDLSF